MYRLFRRISGTEENHQDEMVSRDEVECGGEESGNGNEGDKHQSVLRIDDARARESLLFNNHSPLSLSARTVSTSRNINSSRRKGPVLI